MPSYLRFFLLPLFLTAGLAALLGGCYYPVPPETGGLGGDELRQTLQAAAHATLAVPAEPVQPPPPAPGPETTPLTGLPPTPTVTVLPPQPPADGFIRYTTRSGDTLPALAARFEVLPAQIGLPPGAGEAGYLPIGLVLDIPDVVGDTGPGELLLPDAALVYSPLAGDFDPAAFALEAGGYLSSYTEYVDGELFGGAELVRRVAVELSVDPRLLLALLELRAGWVYGGAGGARNPDYPIGFGIPDQRGLYQEIQVAATQLNVAYYGWRAGSYNALRFQDGGSRRPDPRLNAGTVAIQHLLAFFDREADWRGELERFRVLYREMFGDPWAAAQTMGPLLPDGLAQPALALPFIPGERWSLTAGPHNAWNAGTPRGALDFSPVTAEPVCAVSSVWVTASAPGVIVRAERNAVALDLDGDGRENTGWLVVYFHLAEEGMIRPGSAVVQDDPLGHPSCQGGRATGKHVHVARKYNGEWLPADGPLPFVLGGWQARADERNYYGFLVRGDELVSASPVGSQTSIIIR